MIPERGLVLLVKLSAFCRAIWTIRRLWAQFVVKDTIPQLLKTAIDYPSGAVACVIDPVPSRQAIGPHMPAVGQYQAE
jgi:hypothetical protein